MPPHARPTDREIVPGVKRFAPWLVGVVLVALWVHSHNEQVREIAQAEYRAADAKAALDTLKPQIIVVVKEVRVQARDVLEETRRYKGMREEALEALGKIEAPDSLKAPIAGAVAQGDSIARKCVSYITASLLVVEKMEKALEATEDERDAYREMLPSTIDKVRSAVTWAGVGSLITLVGLLLR